MRERPAPCLRFCVFLKKGLVFCADKCYNEIDGRKITASSKEYVDYILERLSGLEDVDDKELLQRLFERMYDELPAPRRKGKKGGGRQ